MNHIDLPAKLHALEPDEPQCRHLARLQSINEALFAPNIVASTREIIAVIAQLHLSQDARNLPEPYPPAAG
jgi:hypothetical protein